MRPSAARESAATDSQAPAVVQGDYRHQVDAVLARGTANQALRLLRQLLPCLPAPSGLRLEHPGACYALDATYLAKVDEIARMAGQAEGSVGAVLIAEWVLGRRHATPAWHQFAHAALQQAVSVGDGNALRFVAENGRAFGFSPLECVAHGIAFEARWGTGIPNDPELIELKPLYTKLPKAMSTLTASETAQAQALAWQLSAQFPRRDNF